MKEVQTKHVNPANCTFQPNPILTSHSPPPLSAATSRRFNQQLFWANENGDGPDRVEFMHYPNGFRLAWSGQDLRPLANSTWRQTAHPALGMSASQFFSCFRLNSQKAPLFPINCQTVSLPTSESLPTGMVGRPWKVADARLVLEDGSVWWAKSFGASGTQVGEVVFNTSLTGCIV
ncbi:hypothetical protein OROGR_008137 [Orobanche gracilis]